MRQLPLLLFGFLWLAFGTCAAAVEKSPTQCKTPFFTVFYITTGFGWFLWFREAWGLCFSICCKCRNQFSKNFEEVSANKRVRVGTVVCSGLCSVPWILLVAVTLMVLFGEGCSLASIIPAAPLILCWCIITSVLFVIVLTVIIWGHLVSPPPAAEVMTASDVGSIA